MSPTTPSLTAWRPSISEEDCVASRPDGHGAMGRGEDLLIGNVTAWSPGGAGRLSPTPRDSIAIHQCGLSADVWHAEQGLGEWPERRPGVTSGLSAGLANVPTATMLLAQAAWSMRSPMCHEEVSLIGTHQQECTSVRVVG